jgi:hypothetical protein
MAADAETAVTVATPVHRKFSHPVAMLQGTHQDLDIEKKMIGDARGKERAGDITCVDLESALRVGEITGETKHPENQEADEAGDPLPPRILRPPDPAPGEPARTMSEFTGPRCEQGHAGKDIPERDRQAGIRKHDVCATGTENAGADRRTFAGVNGM